MEDPLKSPSSLLKRRNQSPCLAYSNPPSTIPWCSHTGLENIPQTSRIEVEKLEGLSQIVSIQRNKLFCNASLHSNEMLDSENVCTPKNLGLRWKKLTLTKRLLHKTTVWKGLKQRYKWSSMGAQDRGRHVLLRQKWGSTHPSPRESLGWEGTFLGLEEWVQITVAQGD